MATILDKIVENKRREVDTKSAVDMEAMTLLGSSSAHPVLSMSRNLAESGTGIIAEFKRRSPSKGDIHAGALVSEVVGGYEKNGASACSILTDTVFFGGALTDLCVARQAVSLPLLRKDFIVSEYQIYEARAYGANAILLIAAVLSFDEIIRFTRVAHSLHLEVLLEMHSREELDRFNPEVDMVGINNRNLATFVTDPALSLIMAKELPEDVVKVAESGLTSMDEVRKLRDAGYRGFLIGETFMKTGNPGETLKQFING